jgi:hypothetical protein
MSLSAKTFKAASVGSPTLVKVPLDLSTSILEVLLKTQPILSFSISSALFDLGFFFYSSFTSYLHPMGS